MKKKVNSILAGTLAIALAVAGMSVIPTGEVKAGEISPLATLTFDDSSNIVSAHDSAAAIKTDAEKGSVISLGEGSDSTDMVGAEVTNPFSDATINTAGAKAYDVNDVASSYNDALGIKAEADICTTSKFAVRAAGTGGADWSGLTISNVTMMNGAVAEARNNPDMTIYVNDKDGNYAGADLAQQAMGDTKGATLVTDKGVTRKDGSREVKVSSYKPEKEESYFRPIWDKDDGLSMNFWVKVPEGTTNDTVLFSFFNEESVKRYGELTEAGENGDRFAKFNNYTGHLYFTADGSIQFAECSFGAGMSNIGGDGNYQYGRYPGSRNRYEASSVGSSQGLTPVKKAGQWVYVSLVFENDFISVYYDGEKVNYIESGASSNNNTDNGKFTQNWDEPEKSPDWVNGEVTTSYKTFNGYFASRNTPTYCLVNSGIYSQIPIWVKSDNKPMTNKLKFQKFEFMTTQTGTQRALLSFPRMTLCQWLQDVGTKLYLGGASGKDLAVVDANTGTGQFTKQYKCKADTQFDSISFYKEALTEDEVKSVYIAAGGTTEPSQSPDASKSPDVSSAPSDTPSTAPSDVPTAAPTVAPTAAPTAAPTEVPTAAPTVAPTEVPTESPSVEPTESRLMGDVNDDGKADAKDALDILKHAAKITTLSEEAQTVADVNRDESIDAKDALKILRVAAKVDKDFE